MERGREGERGGAWFRKGPCMMFRKLIQAQVYSVESFSGRSETSACPHCIEAELPDVADKTDREVL